MSSLLDKTQRQRSNHIKSIGERTQRTCLPFEHSVYNEEEEAEVDHAVPVAHEYRVGRAEMGLPLC